MVPKKIKLRKSRVKSKITSDTLLEYFAATGPKLLRPTKGILRHPSIAITLPGATYASELWDWDTYWTCRGLLSLSRRLGDRDLHRRVCLHAQGSLACFFEAQGESGRIPVMIRENNPDPFGSLKPGNLETNQAKPVFGQLALLVSDALLDAEWFRTSFDRLLRFYDSWMTQNLSSIGLLVWGSDTTIGVDNDPTTFGRPSFSSANLLLNCLFYQDLVAAAELARRLKRLTDRADLTAKARNLSKLIRKYCWDPRDSFYYTVDVQCRDRRAELIPHYPLGMKTSWSCMPLRIQLFTGFVPMWSGLASDEQMEDLVRLHYLNPHTFNAPYGVRTLSAKEPMFSLASSGNPSNWLGPIWLLANYLVWKGLKDHNFRRESELLASKTLRLLVSDLKTSGTLHEYYHPETGQPLSHGDFLDWNLLALEMI